MFAVINSGMAKEIRFGLVSSPVAFVFVFVVVL